MPRGLRRSYAERMAIRPQPSNYIQGIDSLKLGDRVVLWLRVSRRQQDHRGNLDASEANLRQIAASLGVIVVGKVRYVGSGVSPLFEWHEAANLARSLGAKLLAETTNRFIRHSLYHSQLCPHAQANWHDLEDLVFCTGDIPLVTVLNPDATWREERAYHSMRGKRIRGNLGGRPKKPKPGYKKEIRLRLSPEVKRLKKLEISNREIARRLEISEKNVRRWSAAFFDPDN